MHKIINYTRHPLKIYTEEGGEIEIESSGEIRCVFRPIRQYAVMYGSLQIPVYKTKYSEIINIELLDKKSKDTIYVVSRHTAIAIKELFPGEYDNIVFPNEVETSKYTGKPLGCRSFAFA